MESRERLWLVVGVCLGAGIALAARHWSRGLGRKEGEDHEQELELEWPSRALVWKERLEADESEVRVRLREWDDPVWRRASGWKGE